MNSVRTRIVIPVHNRRETTLRCLDNLSRLGVLEWAGVIVVDSGSTDGTPDAVSERYPQVEVLRESPDLWWTGCTEKGMRRAVAEGAECVVWLNDDCRPRPGAIRALVDFALHHVCIATAQSVTNSGHRYGGHRKTALGLKAVVCEDDASLDCDCCNGNCVAIPVQVVRAIGFPDAQAMPHSRADSDYGLRATREGFRCRIIGKAMCDNDENLASDRQSWLLSDVDVRKVSRGFSQVGNAYYLPAFFRLCVRHWRAWGLVLFFGPYARFLCIVVIRAIVPRAFLRRFYGKRSEAWQRAARGDRTPKYDAGRMSMNSPPDLAISTGQSGEQTIALLTNEYPPVAGGIATYCHELAHAIHEAGSQITVVAANKTAGDRDFDRRQSMPILRTREYSSAIFRHAARLVTLVRLIRQKNVAVLWAAEWRTGLVVAVLSAVFRLPFAVTVYGSELLEAADRRHLRALASRVYRRASLVLSISRYTSGLAAEFGIAQDKIVTLAHAIDTRAFGLDAAQIERLRRRWELTGKKVILTLARVTPRKGQDMVIRSLPAILNRIENVVYVVAGEGEDTDRLRRMANGLGIGDHVLFVGRVQDAEKAAFYGLCDVYALISRREGTLVEGLGLTLLEAGACAKPVVAGRHGGVSEVVEPDVTGLLVNPRDVNGVADALVRVLSDAALASRLGANAQRHIQDGLNWRKSAAQALGAFSEVGRQSAKR